MSRTVRDAALESRTARGKLDPSGQPYYRALEPGLLHLGYRKPRSGAGKWLARVYAGDGKYRLHKIAVADDLSDADGKVILSFKQAQDAARKLMVTAAGGGVGTVGDAIEAYVRSLETDGRPAATVKRTRLVDALERANPAPGEIAADMTGEEGVVEGGDQGGADPVCGCTPRAAIVTSGTVNTVTLLVPVAGAQSRRPAGEVGEPTLELLGGELRELDLA